MGEGREGPRHHPLDITSTLCNNVVIASVTPPIAHKHERTSRRTRDPAALCVNSGRRPTIELSHYRNDPLGFVRDILRDAGPLYHKQEEIFQALATDTRRASVVGCNSSGKDWAAARAILWWIETRPHAKVIISGPTLRQVHKSVWDELRAAHAACADRLEGSIKSGEYHAGPDRLALCLTSNNSQNLLGFHSPELMVVVTEAQGVKQSYFEALKRLNPKKMLLLGNPFSLTGEFYDSHHGKSDLYERVQISAFDSPNVRENRADALPGLVTIEDIDERRREWGEDAPLYIGSILGQFPPSLEDSLTSRVHVDDAMQRWQRETPSPTGGGSLNSPPKAGEMPEGQRGRSGEAAHTPSPEDGGGLGRGLSPLAAIINADVPTEIRNLPWRMGVDVARYGSDKSVICLRRGHRVERLIAFEKIDTMRLADEVRDIAETLGVPAVFVDETGVGGGVVDRLQQLRVPVYGVEGGGKANRSSQFENLRAETFWEVARRLREREMSLPPDNELAAQLLAMRYEVSSAERIRLDSKPQLRRKGVASPDRADALALAFMEPPSLQIWM